MNTPTPITKPARVDRLDALRGFALFGIIMVNGPLYGLTLFQDQLPTPATWTTADHVARFVVGWLFESKFFVLFSFLFGYGTAMQMRGADAATTRARLTRRMFGLLGLGALNGAFLFCGDILTAYGALGLVFLYAAVPGLARRANPTRAALTLVAVLLVVQMLIDAASATPEVGALLVIENAAELAAEARAAYLSDNVWTVAAQRFGDYTLSIAWELACMAPVVLACIAAGWAAAQNRALEGERFDLWGALKPAARVALPVVGLAGSFAYAWMHRRGQLVDELAGDPVGGLSYALHVTASLALATSYVGALAALEQTRAGQALYRVLAPLGRMSLSAYLGESLFASLVFAGYGLGLYDQTGALTIALIGCGIYATIAVLAHLWFRAFRIGPVEWLLRSVTYWRVEPLR